MIPDNNDAGGGRVRFKGDPVPGESGSGREPEIPLSKNVQATSVEMLNQDDDENDEEETGKRKAPKGSPSEDDDDMADDEDVMSSNYSRERIGSRVGEALETAQQVDLVEQQLDTEDFVICMFPTSVNIQDKGIMHHFGPGPQPVPISLAGDGKGTKMHHWLRTNKVKRMGKPQPREMK